MFERIPEAERVYVDESGCNEYYTRTHDRAFRGVKVEDTKRGRRYARTNIIAGYCRCGILAQKIYPGTTNAAFFEDWFEFDSSWLRRFEQGKSGIRVETLIQLAKGLKIPSGTIVAAMENALENPEKWLADMKKGM